MNPTTLSVELSAAGFSLRVSADGKLYVSPAGKLSVHQRDQIRVSRGALIDLLSGVTDDPATWPEGVVWKPGQRGLSAEPRRCPGCELCSWKKAATGGLT